MIQSQKSKCNLRLYINRSIHKTHILCTVRGCKLAGDICSCDKQLQTTTEVLQLFAVTFISKETAPLISSTGLLMGSSSSEEHHSLKQKPQTGELLIFKLATPVNKVCYESFHMEDTGTKGEVTCCIQTILSLQNVKWCYSQNVP